MRIAAKNSIHKITYAIYVYRIVDHKTLYNASKDTNLDPLQKNYKKRTNFVFLNL